jgi:hypothetical protein
VKSSIIYAKVNSNGDLQKLKSALNEGLNAGLTVNEIRRLLNQPRQRETRAHRIRIKPEFAVKH